MSWRHFKIVFFSEHWFKGAMTLSIMTFGITTLSIMCLFVTLGKKDTQHRHIQLSTIESHYAEWCCPECRCAECHGTILILCLLNNSFKGAMTLSIMTFSI